MFTEDGRRGNRQAMSEAGLAARLEKVRERLHGLLAYIQSDDDGTGTCVAELVYRQYTDGTGQKTQDRVRLTFGGDGPESQLCGTVTRLADDVAAHLAR